MAKQPSTPAYKARAEACNEFTRTHSAMDARNTIDRRLAQLTALLQSIHGGGFESFSTLSERLQDNLLWLAADLASEVQDQFGEFCGSERVEVQHG